MMWDEIIGHEAAKRLLRAHLASGRVAQAYLLAGVDGVGKRLLALVMARALVCEQADDLPCNRCPVCAKVEQGAHPDVHVLSPGGASEQIKIDDIRQVLGRIALRPFSARWQVVVLPGAERLTEEAANSLLKALEEPASCTRFLLTTSRLSQCLPTIVSRCQLIRCEPLAPEVLAELLARQKRCAPDMARAVARLSGGSVVSAIELLDRWASHQQLLARLADEQPVAWLTQPMPETRQEVAHLLDGLMAWLRDVAVAALADPSAVAHGSHAAALRRQAQRLDAGRCIEAAFELVALRDSLEQFVSPRLVASLAREKWLSLHV